MTPGFVAGTVTAQRAVVAIETGRTGRLTSFALVARLATALAGLRNTNITTHNKTSPGSTQVLFAVIRLNDSLWFTFFSVGL